ncbi:MAG: prepilin peptidase [Candidatus Peregrinibacteria bacterium]
MLIPNLFFLFFLFGLGLFFGSFANVVVLRLHAEQNGIFGGRSECPKCKHLLGFWDLVPLFSWIFLLGKCRYCKNPISWRYPFGEAIMGILWVFLFFFSGISLESILSGVDMARAGYFLLLGFFVHILFFADLYFSEVHRYVSVPAIAVALLFLPFSFTPTLSHALLGALIPIAFFGTQILLSRFVFTSRGDWVGEGDLDLGILMGLVLGWKGVMIALFLSYLLGSFVGVAVMIKKGRGEQVPFGPFLLIAMIITLFWGQYIADWYWGILGL